MKKRHEQRANSPTTCGLIAARSIGDPRQARLEALFAAKKDPAMALIELGALHSGQTEQRFRNGMVNAGDKVFVHPKEVPGLIAALLVRTRNNLADAESVRDDVLTAAFVSYAIMAIHPFANGNGRTAIDFSQYILMLRWGMKASPMAPPSDLHRIVARIYVALDPRIDATAEGLIAERDRLLWKIEESSLQHLRRDDAFKTAADVFVACRKKAS